MVLFYFRDAFDFVRKTYYEQKTTISETSLIISFHKLLEVLKTSRSRIILTVTAEIYASAIFDTKSLDIQNCLSEYVGKMSSDLQLESLEVMYRMCNQNFFPEQCYKLATDYFYPLVINSKSTSLQEFCNRHIEEILDILKNKSSNPNTWLQKIIGFIIIDAMFYKLLVETDHSSIAASAFPEKEVSGKELIKEILKLTLATFKEDCDSSETETRELFRLYQCTSYKALVSIISNTQKDLKFYMFLFTRIDNGEDILWKKLIDLNKRYNFEQDFDLIPSWKSRFTSIRNAVRKTKQQRGNTSSTVRYIESQNLFNSTLAEDVTKFDFSNTTLRNKSEQEESVENNEVFCQHEVELESVEINNHECMATVCGLITYIVENDISPLPNPDEVTELPEWMMAIRKILMSDFSHTNIKIFLIKVVENTKQVFALYAKWFYEPVMKFIVDGCAGTCINFFTYDLVS